ncbi:MAG: hypothetical protein ACFFG0_04065 [Candidatus Thorarchaeota archaeon]
MSFDFSKINYLREIDEDCQSCSILVKYCFVLITSKYHLEKSKTCPCRNCLLRVMCSKMCEERSEYFKGISIEERMLK